MPTLTEQDTVHAQHYASHFVLKHRYDTQHTETRWTLPPYQLEEQPVDFTTFHVPFTLRHQFRMYTLTFDQAACDQLSCFRYKQTGQLCTPADPPTTIHLASIPYLACQPSCKDNWIDAATPLIDEVAFVDGKCQRRLTQFKRWCLFPASRSDYTSESYIPPFRYDDATEECHFTPEYCERFGLDVGMDQTCVRSTTQAFVEDYVIGQSMYREIKIPHKIRKRIWKREDGVEEVLKGLSFDLGVDAAFWSARQLVLKAVPLYSSPAMKILIAQLQTLYGKTVVKHAVMASILYSARLALTAQMAIKVASSIGTAATGVGLMLTALAIMGMVADAIDPYRFNERVDTAFIQTVKDAIRSEYHSVFKGDLEVTPVPIMTILTEGLLNDDEQALVLSRIALYLSHLTVNSRGETIHYDPGQTLEDYLNQWVSATHNQTPPELEQQMNTHFSTYSLIFSVITGLFLAVSL